MDNDDWVTRLAELREAGMPCVLITVMGERGSVPRGGGSKMIITAEQSWLTIGGGSSNSGVWKLPVKCCSREKAIPAMSSFRWEPDLPNVVAGPSPSFLSRCGIHARRLWFSGPAM